MEDLGTANTAGSVSLIGTVFLWVTDIQPGATLIATVITIVCGVLAAILYVMKIMEKRKEFKKPKL